VTAPASPDSPVSESRRIVVLDVLRGVALLGILAVNIQSFSMPAAAYSNPTAYGDLAGANRWVWVVSHLFVDRKLLSLFSVLFGAGIVMMTGRVEASGRSAAGLHVRRMTWLIVFGVLHAYGLWYGDILFFYGVCGLLVFPLRRLSPGVSIAAGLAAVSVASWLSVASGVAVEQGWGVDAAEAAARWAPGADVLGVEIDAYRAGWVGQLAARAPMALLFETGVFLFWGLWRAGGLMLVGMGLYKLGILQGARSTRFYVAGALAGPALGLPVVAWGVVRNFAAGWSAEYSQYFGNQLNYWGSLPVSFGYLCLVVLLCRVPRLAHVRSPLAAVGRTALSNYLLQSVLCTWLFYGHGLGWFGAVERTGQAAVVVAVWVVQLVVSSLWLRRFRFGPAEWAWRSLTYVRLQPMLREPPPASARNSVSA
jgi:uncharacterized protein